MKLPRDFQPPPGTTGHGVNLSALSLTSQGEKSARPKYGNRKTGADGFTFDSKAEAERYRLLRLLEISGVIRDLELQPEFDLYTEGVFICRYVADFRYVPILGPRAGETIIEDVKSEPTRKNRAYRIKIKLMEANGYKVEEICDRAPLPRKKKN